MRIAHILIGSVIALSSLALSAFPSAAQNWPTRPVRVILPLGPGAAADIGVRLIAEKLAAKWGQPVVVENRPGGDGFVAITAFLSAHDDHMLFFGPAASFTAHPYLHDKLPYDPRDLAPVARVSATLISLTAPPQLNVNSLGELFAMARAAPGKIELGLRHRRHRRGDRGFPQARRPRHGESAVPRWGPGAERRGRRPPAVLLVVACDRAGRDRGRAASSSWPSPPPDLRRWCPACRPPSRPDFPGSPSTGWSVSTVRATCRTLARAHRRRCPPGPRRSDDRAAAGGRRTGGGPGLGRRVRRRHR